jgi:D-alanine transaminase
VTTSLRSTVTEGASSSAFIVTETGEILTRPLSEAILPGVTRQSILTLCAECGSRVIERQFTVAEAYAAREAFITAAGLVAVPVVKIDGRMRQDIPEVVQGYRL